MTAPLGLWDALYRLETACEALGAERALNGVNGPSAAAQDAVVTARARVSALLTVLESRQPADRKAVKRPGAAEA